ncbi:hypothetical protein AY599_06605 [Leptolyngbya valderiana BDU 20041]|nr:hypothetical protein AY599_06605 [Leptolyngbya valderiana BDU 20041]
MKCPGCEYELWNLKAGPCPECGRPFKPSDFDFLPNAVKFCCPHCSQAYYGTNENGQLEPDTFDCVSCGRHVTTDDMLLLPAEALGKRTPTKSINPWLDSNRKRRWFATIAAGFGQPGRLLEATPAIGSSSRATSYALLNFVMAGMFILVLMAVASLGGGMGGGGDFLLALLAVVLGPAVLMGVWTLVAHGILKLFKQPTPDGLGRTYQAIAFTSGAWLLALLPCFGWTFGFLAWSLCAPVAVYRAHKCKLWAAIVATGGPPLAVVLTVAGLYAWLIFGTMGMMQSMNVQQAWAAQSQLDFEVIMLANELRDNVKAGTPPLHGASLLGQSSLTPYSAFAEANNFDVLIGTHRASQLDMMDPNRREAALRAITSTWPSDVTAHRIGRIIFTHHGIDPGDDPALWLLIELPNTPGDTIADAVHLDGASMFDVGTGAQFEIDQQNQLRAKAGLPPLPSFQTMTAGTGPWTAADGTPPPATPGVP